MGTAMTRTDAPSGASLAGASPAGTAGTAVTVSIHTADEAVEAARAYAESISGAVIERDRAGSVPVAELAALDASGLLAIIVPRAYGGPELGATVLAEVIAAIAAVDPAIAQVPQPHFLFTDVLAVWGRPAAGPAVRGGAGRRPVRQRAGRAGRGARAGPEDTTAPGQPCPGTCA